jgi:hypothetical protein
LRVLFPAGDEDWNSIHNRVGTATGSAEQARLFFKAKSAEADWTGQLVEDCRIEGWRSFGIGRHGVVTGSLRLD